MLPNFCFSIERWRFNKEYQVYVSTKGRIKDKQKKIIKIVVTDKGYCRVPTINGKALVHRLVMMTWKPTNNMRNLTVDHLNHNKRDNSLKNLEWVSKDENQLRARNDFFLEAEYTPELAEFDGEKEIIYLNGFPFKWNDAFQFMKQCGNCSQVSNKTVTKSMQRALSGHNKGRYYGIKMSK